MYDIWVLARFCFILLQTEYKYLFGSIVQGSLEHFCSLLLQAIVINVEWLIIIIFYYCIFAVDSSIPTLDIVFIW